MTEKEYEDKLNALLIKYEPIKEEYRIEITVCEFFNGSTSLIIHFWKRKYDYAGKEYIPESWEASFLDVNEELEESWNFNSIEEANDILNKMRGKIEFYHTRTSRWYD